MDKYHERGGLEHLRKALERNFCPPFGVALDIAEMLQPIDCEEDDSFINAEPPDTMLGIYKPNLISYQCRRLLGVARNPVAVSKDYKDSLSFQILGQLVINRDIIRGMKTWRWSFNGQQGMVLKETPNKIVNTLLISNNLIWLKRLMLFMYYENLFHVCQEPKLAQAYTSWTYILFKKHLARHADLDWMNIRIRNDLAKANFDY